MINIDFPLTPHTRILKKQFDDLAFELSQARIINEAHKQLNGELREEIAKLRKELETSKLERETTLRRDAERRAQSFGAYINSMPFPDEWEAIIGAADALADAVERTGWVLQATSLDIYKKMREILEAYHKARM